MNKEIGIKKGRKGMKKRILSTILVVCMMFSMLPSAVFADGPSMPTAPSITTTSLPNGVVDTAYNETLTATGAAITWSVTDGSLPDGLSLDESTGAITGTPTTAGKCEFTVKASNGTEPDATKVLSINIVGISTEQFSLATGETYYFDLSGEKDNIGTINSAVPDETLHYVPFTYTGTVNAYSYPWPETFQGSERSLFVADYNISNIVTWERLNQNDLILGQSKTFDTNYKLRSLSGGCTWINGTISPSNNEWDSILGKSELTNPIKNWSGLFSYTQDYYNGRNGYRCVIRGNDSATKWSDINVNNNEAFLGFRPALEVIDPVTLGSDGLKAVTLNLNGGSFDTNGSVADGVKDSIKIVCAGGSFKAPSAAGLTRPSGNTDTGFHWKGSDNKPYAVGDSVPNSVTILTAQWVEAPTVPSKTAPSITTTSLPNGVVGTAYSQTLTATGSTPITWSVESHSLPDGLSLEPSTGEISGTPTAEGIFSFTAKVANDTSPDATKELSITIKPAATVPTPGQIWNGTSAAYFAGGAGTETDPYQIATAEQLCLLSSVINGMDYSDKNKPIRYTDSTRKVVSGQDAQTPEYLQKAYYKLTADIVLNDTTNWESWGTNAPANSWKPIGTLNISNESDYNAMQFCGFFDGDGHTIRGMYFSDTTDAAWDGSAGGVIVGLFSYGVGCKINSVTVSESYIYGYSQVGGIIGSVNSSYENGNYIGDSTVSNCKNSGTVISADSVVGGIVATSSAKVENCQNSGTVTNTSKWKYDTTIASGGIAGSALEVVGCYNSGKVSGNFNVGGIAGGAFVVKDCRNDGPISDIYHPVFDTQTEFVTNSIGGIIGRIYTAGAVDNCINTGFVSGNQLVGGIIGNAFEDDESSKTNTVTIKNCKNSGDVEAIGYSDSLPLGMEAGGIAGQILGGSIESCQNSGKITANSKIAGGIVGNNFGLIKNCLNSGSFSTLQAGGGIVGQNCIGDKAMAIENCQNIGTFIEFVDPVLNSKFYKGSYIGGVVGRAYNSSSKALINGCFSPRRLVPKAIENYGQAEEYYGYLTGDGVVEDNNSCDAFGGISMSPPRPIVAPGGNSDLTLDGVGSNTVTWHIAGAGKSGTKLSNIGSNGANITIASDETAKAITVFAMVLGKDGLTVGAAAVTVNIGTPPMATTGPWDGSAAQYFDGGKGTEAEPFEIANAEQLALLADVINGGISRKVMEGGNCIKYDVLQKAYYKLTADIVLNDTAQWENWDKVAPFMEWIPIGHRTDYLESNRNWGTHFKGTFDGNNHTVSGMYINSLSPGTWNGKDYGLTYGGLFGDVVSCTIKNVSVEKSFVKGFSASGIVGLARGSNIIGCSNGGTIIASPSGKIESNSAGGILVSGDEGTNLTGCTNTGSVTGNAYVGGIAGSIGNGSTAQNCINFGPVNSNDVGRVEFIGGLIGTVGSKYGSGDNCTIINCQNLGKINVSNWFRSAIGGLIGFNGVNSTVTDCFTPRGLVTEATGDIGEKDKPDFSYKYYLGHFIGEDVSQTKPGITTDDFGGISMSPKSATVIRGNSKDFTLTGSGSSTIKWYVSGGTKSGTAMSSTSTSGATLNVAADETSKTLTVIAVAYDSTGKVVGTATATVTVKSSDKIWNGKSALYFDGGTGSKDDPYQIANGEQLCLLSAVINQMDYTGTSPASFGEGERKVVENQDAKPYSYLQSAYYKLTANIALNDSLDYEGWEQNSPANRWKPIGVYSVPRTEKPFKGNFDGNGKIISGLFVSGDGDRPWDGTSGMNNLGLFSYVSGQVKNVTLVESLIYKTGANGGITAINKGTITNCNNAGTVSGYFDCGGIAATNYGTITDCKNSGTVKITAQNAGGIAAVNMGTITNCKNSGTISQDGNTTGGIVGSNGFKEWTPDDNGEIVGGLIKSCENTGSVNGQFIVGGIAGENLESSTVSGCVSGIGLVKDATGDIGVADKPDNIKYYLGHIIGKNAGTYDDGSVPTAPEITTTTLPNGVVGTAYSQTLKATGTTPITWSVASGNLPSGLSLNTSTGAITGTPTVAGTYNFTVKATNGVNPDATKEFSITVTSTISVTLQDSAASLDFGSVLEGYSTAPVAQTVTLKNTGIDTITISQPVSANYDIGSLSKTTLAANETATFTVAPKTGLRAKNYDSIIPIMKDAYTFGNVTAKFTVISPTPIAPTITTGSLADGVLGAAYSQTLAATGTTPITWSVASGSLPAGLSLDTDTGAITGTPNAAGTFNFTVKAANGTAPDATKELSITVTSPVTSVSVDPATATVKKTKTQQFTANVSGTATVKSVTWSVSGGSKSTIDSNGLLTVSGMETAATLTVKVTSKVDNTKFGTATVTVTAAPKNCTVTFDSDGGSAIDPISGIEEGKTIKLPNIPTKDSCRFDGWYTAKNGGGTMFTGSTIVNNNITVYAKWTKLVTVSGIVVDEKDGKPISGASVTLSPANGTTAVTTGADGKFTFTNVPEDMFTATATFTDSSSVTVNVTGDYGNVKIVKPKPYITITTQPQDGIIIKGIAGQSATFNVLGKRTPHIANSIAYEWWWLKGATPVGTTPDEKMTGSGSQMTINQDNGNIPGSGTYKLYAYVYDADAMIDAYSRVATLKVVGTNTIEGIVKNSDNTPVTGAAIELVYAGGAWPYGSVAMTTSKNAQTTKDGTYKFETVPDGKYKLVITLPGGGQITYGPYDFPGSNPDPVKPIDPGIVIPAAPSIQVSGQPQDATVKNDTAVTISVDAASTDGTALTYQWYSNTKNSNIGGTAISGATSADYIPSTAKKGTTYYYCVVTGGSLDAVTTRAAKITVNTYGTIAGTVQTKEKQTIEGAKVELISIDTPVKTGFTTSTNPQTTVADGKYKFVEVPDGQYKLKITIADGEIFVVQPINVPYVNTDIPVTPPDKPTISISSQPKSITVALHDTAEFTVNAGVSNNGTVMYQWYSNTTSSTTGGTAITGATAATYRASTNDKSVSYYYCVVKSTGADTVTSSIAKLTVRNTPVNNVVTIEGDVVDESNNKKEGAAVTISPKAGTSENPQTTGISGHYKFENLPDGKYTITVKLPSGGVIIKEVVIEDGEITPALPINIAVPAENSITIAQQLTDIEVTTEMDAVYTAKATATKADVSYQWYKNTTNANSGGTKLDGKTAATLTLGKQEEGVSYYYCVISSTGAADKATNAAKLTVTKAGSNKGDLEGGIVNDDDGKPVAGASVKMMKKGTDGTQFGSTVITGEDGKYAFTAIPYGSYSLVAEKDAQIITRQIAIRTAKTNENLTLPSGGKLTKVIIQGSNTPSVAIGNLEEMFTSADNTIAKQAGAQVEIKLVVQQTDTPANKEQIDSALGQNKKVGVYLDATLVKTISGTVAEDTTESIQPPDGQTLRIVLDIPMELQGKSGYKVLRAHSENGVTDTKIIDPDYDSDLQTLSFDADAFSTYAVVYTQAQKHSITVIGSEAGASSGTGLYEEGDTVTIKAGTRSGYSFAGWTSTDGVTFANASDATTTFTMLAKAITVIANWKSDGNNGNNSNNSSSSSSYDYYTITATASEGGSISPSGSVSVREGLSKTFTITSSNGYVISDLIIDGKSVGAKNSYTFDNVYSNHSIKAEFKIAENVNPSTGIHFEDVNENDWFYKNVMAAVENRWFKGTSGTTFSPYLSTERGMIATVIWNMEEQPKPINPSIFKDVPANAWFHDGVTWANENNEIVKGYGNGLFGPKDNITREQMVSILYRYAAFKGYDVFGKTSLDGFKDGNKTSDCFVKAMKWAVANGLLKGKGNGILDPKGHATRAEVATILVKFDKLFGEK